MISPGTRLQPPASLGELGGDPLDERAAVLGTGIAGEEWSSAQKPDLTSIAVYCQTAPFVPERRPNVEAVDPDQLARPRGLDVALGLGLGRRRS